MLPTEIAGQKRNIVNVLPSSLDFAGPVRKSPHQSLPPISPRGLPKAEQYLLGFAGARWIVQKLPNPRLWSSALLDTPFTALVQHPRLCRVHSVPTYEQSQLSPRVGKAVAVCLGAMSAPSPSPGPVQPLRSALKGDNDSPSIKGTSVFISATTYLHIPNSTCGLSSRAHHLSGGGWVASPRAPVAFVDEGR